MNKNLSISGATKSAILLLIIAAVTACNNSSGVGKKPDVIKRDSVQVLALYRSAMKEEVKHGLVIRVTTDTLMYVDIDTVTKQKQWTVDTFYVVYYPTPVDSALSKQYNVPIKDSTGRTNVINLIVATDKRFVRSGWERADTNTVREMLNIR